MNLDFCTEAQRQVITTLDAPLMVSAGAGSGKTFTLTQRVACALGVLESERAFLDSVDDVLAITFTTKAAAELKSRIKGILFAEDLPQEALKVDNAWISTIHAMAARILREHALEVGVDPSFEVISEATAEELLDEALESVIFQSRDDEDVLIKELLQTEKLRGSGFSDAGVVDYTRAILARVHAMPEGFDALQFSTSTTSPSLLMRSLLESAQELEKAINGVSGKVSKAIPSFLDRLSEGRAKVQRWLDASEGTSFEDEDFDGVGFCEAFYSLPVSAGNVGKAYKEVIAPWQEALVELNREVKAGFAARWLPAVVTLARRVDQAFQTLKGSSRFDHNDLLLRCAQALKDHPSLAQSLQNRFKLIMVDEFQDTDRLQVDIIKRIARPGFSNVCTVGDAQQSIYRFRGADVNVFTEYRRNLQETAERNPVVSMGKNFRSHGDILAFVESIFSQPSVFGRDFLSLEAGSTLNTEEDPLFQHRPRINVSVIHNQQGKVSRTAVREMAAKSIAHYFAELHREGAPAEDMVVLLGAMTHADVYAKALREEGLASMITGGSVFSTLPEPLLVAQLLRLAVTFNDEEALYPVLASPLFALSDDVLLVLSSCPSDSGPWKKRPLAQGFTGATAITDMEKAGLAEFDIQAFESCKQLLRAYANQVQRFGAALALRRLFVDSGYLDRLNNEGVDGLASAGNILKALRIVEQLESQSTGIASLSSAFEAHLATAKEAPGMLATAQNDYVRIMTVHASKGLEFPHVAVAELREGRETPGKLVVENIGQATYAAASLVPSGNWDDAVQKIDKLKDKFETQEPTTLTNADPSRVSALLVSLSPAQRFDALACYAEDQAAAEARRLLYVALTRASKSLFLSLLPRTKPSDGYENAGIVTDVFGAIPWDTQSVTGCEAIDYGGSTPAQVTFSYVSELSFEDENSPSNPPEEVNASCDATDNLPCPSFIVPQREKESLPFMVPHNFSHSGLYSYSSLSQNAYGKSSDALEVSKEASLAAAEDTDDGRGSATALGTAFHRLAQQAIERSEQGSLYTPDEQAIEAQIVQEDLTASQQKRLRNALTRWLASEEAHRFASFSRRLAEVPFAVNISSSGEGTLKNLEFKSDGFILEGEIDGLADNGDGAAFLIDYKTGGSPSETSEALEAKHRFQAGCYGYALLRSGYTSVEAHFLRIEQESSDNASSVQVVPYFFTTEDISSLENLIREHYQEAVHDA